MRVEVVESRTVKKWVEVKETEDKIVFIAWDGVEFDNELYCLRHERYEYTAEKHVCVIMGMEVDYYEIKNQYELRQFFYAHDESSDLESKIGDLEFPKYIRNTCEESSFGEGDWDSVYKFSSSKEYEFFCNGDYDELKIDDIVEALNLT